MRKMSRNTCECACIVMNMASGSFHKPQISLPPGNTGYVHILTLVIVKMFKNVFIVLRNCNSCKTSSSLQCVGHGHNTSSPHEIHSGISDVGPYGLMTSPSTLEGWCKWLSRSDQHNSGSFQGLVSAVEWRGVTMTKSCSRRRCSA